MPKKYPLKNFKHKIEICDNVSAPTEEGAEKHNRIPLHAKPIWAMLDGSVNPYRINSFRINTDDRDKATHIFVIREPCDFEVNPKQWIYRSYMGRDEWFKILATSDAEEGLQCYTRILAAIWTRDSAKLDPETQDIPCEDIQPDESPYFSYRDVF